MISDNYIYQAANFLQELFDSLSGNDKVSLQKIFHKYSRKFLLQHELSLQKEILKYMESTPNQRKKKKEWNDPENNGKRLLLIYYSFKYMYKGYFLLKKISNAPEHGGYREVVAMYSMLADEIVREVSIVNIILDEKLELNIGD